MSEKPKASTRAKVLIRATGIAIAGTRVDEVGGVVDLLHSEANRQNLFKLGEHVLNAIGDLDGVTAGELIDRNTDRRCALEVHSVNAINLTTQLNPSNVLETHQATSIRGAKDDVFELLGTGQTPLQLHGEGVFLPLRSRGTTDLAGGHHRF